MHAAVGMFAGILLTADYAAAGFGIIALVSVRQTLEYLKRDDTPGIDLAYHLGGLLCGIGFGLLRFM